LKVALVMWPDSFEDWYEPHGITRESFLRDYEGEWTISLASALGAAGHQVHIVYSSRVGAAAARQQPSGATVHFVRAPLAYRVFLHAAWGERRLPGVDRLWPAAPVTAALSAALVSRLRSLRPDVVMVQDYESLRYDVLAPLLRAARLKVVGLDTGGSARPSPFPWKQTTRSLASTLLAANQPEADRLLAAGHRRARSWPAPVRTDVFVVADRARARQSLGLPTGEKVVFSAGRLHPVKNLHLLADACAEVGATLVLAGEGPERARLEGRRQPGLRLLGRLPPDAVARWFAACDVAALASSQEGQPVAVLEALSCGRAAVATGVGGLGGLLEESGAGWLVPPGDGAALAAALREALADPAAADARGARGRELVVTRHSLAAVGESMTEALES
jgi:glycosyltransferase involved in cell wall biosynthesis